TAPLMRGPALWRFTLMAVLSVGKWRSVHIMTHLRASLSLRYSSHMDAETRVYFDDFRRELSGHFRVITARFDTIDRRFDTVDQRFDAIDQRFEGMDLRFEAIDRRFEGIDQRFDGIDQRFDTLDERIDAVRRELGVLVEDVRHDLRAVAEM